MSKKNNDKKQNLFKRLILGDDKDIVDEQPSSGTSTPNRPPPRAPVFTNEEDTMYYLAREFSKQAYTEENKQKNNPHTTDDQNHDIKHTLESQETLRIALEASKETARKEQQKHVKDKELEDAIVRSILEATKQEEPAKTTQRKSVNTPNYNYQRNNGNATGYDQQYPIHDNNYPNVGYPQSAAYYEPEDAYNYDHDQHQPPRQPQAQPQYAYNNYPPAQPQYTGGNTPNPKYPPTTNQYNNYPPSRTLNIPTQSPPTVANHRAPISYSPPTVGIQTPVHHHQQYHDEVMIDDEFLDPTIIAALERKNREIEEKRLMEQQRVLYAEGESQRQRSRASSHSYPNNNANNIQYYNASEIEQRSRTRTGSHAHTIARNDNSSPCSDNNEGAGVSLDVANIVHPNNATALKAATALIQLARKHIKQHSNTDKNNVLGRETAALQLANLWVNQTALYLNQQDVGLVTSIATPTATKHVDNTYNNTVGVEQTMSHDKPPVVRKPSYHQPAVVPAAAVANNVGWQCEVCTLINKAGNTTCEACGLLRSR